MTVSAFLILDEPPRQWPPVPTRAQVCGVQLTFQGLTMATRQYGTQPWFELAYQTLTDPRDRAAVRQQKRDAGDTHLIVEYFTTTGSIYDEPGQPWQAAISPSGEAHPVWFRSLVEEIIADGLIPIVAFDGDDGDRAMGSPNALRQLPILVSLLAAGDVNLNPYVLYARLWDGVFYGSSPENIANFGRQFRAVLPEGYLAIEHNIGHIPVGNGNADWMGDGMMTTYDVVLSEFGAPLRSDQLWQVAGRLLGAAYVRPPDQPSGDDPDPPHYLQAGSPRGPYYTCAFELTDPGEYTWVRGRCTAADIESDRQYLRALGYTYTG